MCSPPVPIVRDRLNVGDDFTRNAPYPGSMIDPPTPAKSGDASPSPSSSAPRHAPRAGIAIRAAASATSRAPPGARWHRAASSRSRADGHSRPARLHACRPPRNGRDAERKRQDAFGLTAGSGAGQGSGEPSPPAETSTPSLTRATRLPASTRSTPPERRLGRRHARGWTLSARGRRAVPTGPAVSRAVQRHTWRRGEQWGRHSLFRLHLLRPGRPAPCSRSS